jgi:hypothetical protein
MAEKELTAAEKKILEQVAKEWEDIANGGDTSINEKVATEALGDIYEFAKLKRPEVLFFKGPKDALEFCRKELKQEVTQFDAFGLGYDAGWIAFYDFFQRIGKLPTDNKEFEALKSMALSGVWATILFDKLVVVIARPNTVKLDERNRLHCADGPAVAFDDGSLYFFWHNTRVTKKIIMTPEKLTAQEINAERNSEVVRAIVEKLGWAEFMKRIEVKLVDKWFDTSTKLHYELYDFKNRRFELAPRLLKMESPEVLDGTRPTYIEPVHPHLNSCQAARKWQFKEARCTSCHKTIPTTMIRHGDVQLIDHVMCACGGEPEYRWPEPEECNARPELRFAAEA